MSDGKVVIDITGDESEYLRTVAAVEASTAATGAKLASILSTTGKAMTLALTLPILAFGAYSIKAAMDFESSFAGVRKTVNATEEEFDKLAAASKRMSETKPISANDINRIMELGGQLGIAKDKLEQFASVIADLSVTTDLDLEQGAMQMAQYANITGMAQDQFEKFGSTIVALGNNSATTESAILEMAHRIAGAGSQIGLTDAQILALSASMSSVGIEAEAGGTAISTVMSQIDKDVARNSENLAAWAQMAGYESASKFAAAWKASPVEALQMLFKNMDSATQSGDNMNLMLDELGVSSLRQTDMMKRLTGASDLLAKSVDTATGAWDANNAMAKEAEQRYATTESQLKILGNKFENVAATAGGPLLAAINSIVDGLGPLIDFMKNAAQGFADMNPAAQGLATAFLGIVAAAGPLMMLASKLITSFQVMSTALGKTTTTLTANTAAEKANAAAKGTSAAASLTEEAATLRLEAAQAKESINASRIVIAKEKETLYRLQNAATVNVEQEAKAKAVIKQELENIATQKAVQGKNQETIARMASTTATNAGTEATTKGTTAANVHSVALKAQGIAAGVAKGALVGLAMAGIVVLVDWVTKAIEHQQDMTKATEGLRSASSKAIQPIKEQAGAMGNLSSASVGASAALKSALESQLKLVDSITERNAEAETSMGTWQRYGDIIKEYANQTNLSGSAQALLKDAVSKLNAEMGAQYTVTDAVNGVIKDQEGNVLKTTAAIDELIQKKIEQIRIDSIIASLGDAYAQQEKGAKALAKAQKEYNDIMANSAAYGDNFATVADKANNSLKEAKGLYESSGEAIKGYQKELGLATRAQDEGSKSIAAAINSHSLLKATIETTGYSTNDFVTQLTNAGASTEKLGSLTAEQCAAIGSAYDGTFASVQGKLTEFGVVAPQIGAQTGADYAQSIANQREAAVNAVTTTTGISKEKLMQFAADAGVQGDEAMIQFCNEIQAGMYENIYKVDDAANQAANSQRQADISPEGSTWGSDLVRNIGNGMTGLIDWLRGCAEATADAIAGPLHQTVADYGPLSDTDVWGEHLVDNITGGMKKREYALATQSQKMAKIIDKSLRGEMSNLDFATSFSVQPLPPALSTIPVMQTVTVNFTLGDAQIKVTDQTKIDAISTLWPDVQRQLRTMGAV